MRSLDADQLASVAPIITDPNYLITIQLDEPYQWATGAPRATFVAGPVVVGAISPDRATLYVHNEDYKHTQNVVQGSYLGSTVTISWAYDEATPITYFVGVITAIPELDEYLRIECERQGPRVYPRGRFLPPLFNHLPSPGYSIEFDGASITIGE